MNRLRLAAPVLVLAISALLMAGANRSLNARENTASTGSGAIFAATAADGGRLIITRSPVLGDNLAVTIAIDGKQAGVLRRKGTYDRSIAPGRHVLVASPSRSGAPWRGTLDVRAGETYSYVASFNVDRLVLTPTKSR